MSTPKHSKTRLVVTLAHGEEVTVQTTLEDRLAFETAMRKNRSWGKLEDNTMKMLPFLAWNALKRTGKTELTWQEFTTDKTAALSVEPEEQDDDEEADLEVEGLGKDTQTEPSTSSPWSSHETTEEPHGNGDMSEDLD